MTGPTSGGCAGEPLTLNATDLGAGTTYEWFLNGVSLATTSTPTFNTTAASGTYSVMTTNPAIDCPGISNGFVAPIGGGSINLVGPERTLCTSETLQLSATNLGAGTTYEWFRDGISLATTSVPVFNTEAVTGSYTVMATKDGCPSSISNTFQVTVGGGATAAATLSGPAGNICSGDNLQITTSDLGAGTNYEWFRDGVSLGSTSVPVFNIGAAPGSYTVVVTQNGCPSSPSNVFQPSIGTPSGVGIGQPNALCGGGTVQITATDLGPGTTYSWFRNGAFVISTTEPLLMIDDATSADAGTYTVAATRNGCILSLIHI